MPKLYEVKLECDQGSLRAVSPIDIQYVNLSDEGEVVVLNPGMRKEPERFKDTMFDLQAAGLSPVAFDTRWSYPDPISHGLELTRRTRQQQLELRGSEDPSDPSTLQGWYALRRVVALEQGLEQLEVGERSFVGHSDGARISTLATWRNPDLVKQLILLNPAGLGESWHAYKRLVRSNTHEISAMFRGETPVLPLVRSGILSVINSMRGMDLLIQEKRILQATNLWPVLDDLETKDIDVTIISAIHDALVSHEHTLAAAEERPWINFIPTPGRHANAYGSLVRRLLVSELVLK